MWKMVKHPELDTWIDSVIHPADATDGSVVMLCGIAGSGKTTAATILESKGFIRLSIDEEIWSAFGRFGIDYRAEEYSTLQKQAAERVWMRLEELLQQKTPVVIDNSFWKRKTRDQYKRLIECYDRRWLLLYLKVDPSILRARLLQRRERFDANAAFPIEDDLLDSYLKSFQEPSGEGELIFQ
jgi:predicted kinase